MVSSLVEYLVHMQATRVAATHEGYRGSSSRKIKLDHKTITMDTWRRGVKVPVACMSKEWWKMKRLAVAYP